MKGIKYGRGKMEGGGGKTEKGRREDCPFSILHLPFSIFLDWGPPLVWMAVIFFVSAQSTLPSYPEDTIDTLLKKGGHMFAFGLLAVLLWRAMKEAWPDGRATLGAFLVSLLYAVSDEWHQTFVPGRNGTPVDVGIDVAGMLLALALIAWWRAKRHRSVSTAR